MANTTFIDSTGVQRFRASEGAGTDLDPFVLTFKEVSDIAGRLPTKGAKAGSGSVSVVPATDANFAVPLASYGTNTLAVTDALSTGIFLDVSGFRRFRFQVHNSGSNQLSGFEVSSRCHSSGDMQVHAALAADYTSPGASSIIRLCGDLAGASINCTAMFGGAKAIVSLDLTDIFAETLRIRARCATGQSTTLNFVWGGSF
jgi:hypothetical protein